ncbi:MAG: cytochrome b5 domain-containing protein [Longicatena sp.]
MKKLLAIMAVVLLSGCASTSAPKEETKKASTPDTTQTTNDGLKVFSLDELKKYNGTNNQPSYIAVDGEVYDVSEYFKNGKHHDGIKAGSDLSKEFHNEHDKTMLDKVKHVGHFK